jgi:hypothetical protein
MNAAGTRQEEIEAMLRKTSPDARNGSNVTRLRNGEPAASPPEGVSRAQRANHLEFPVERLCKHLYEPFQLTFARHAEQLLRERDDVELLASHRGLTIRAETEEAIDAAVEVLRDFFGSQIHIGAPTIRYHRGSRLEQPWMGLRVKCAPEHFDAIKVALMARNATIVASEIHPTGGVVKACAPLAHLIGYKSELEKLTGGSAEHVMWLSHYAPVESHSG